MTYRRAVLVLADHLGCEPTEQAVYERRLASDPAEYASSFLRATNTELLLVDDGYPPTDVGTTWDEMGELGGCRALPVLRLETRGEHAADEVATARERGYAALKTIAAYRGGLDRVSEHVVAALEANEATGEPLPVQVHCGFGDSDLHLWRADPSYLKPLIERFRDTTFVLLHCYPFVREAGWLAHVYGNVYFDLSLTIPHVARPAVGLLDGRVDHGLHHRRDVDADPVALDERDDRVVRRRPAGHDLRAAVRNLDVRFLGAHSPTVCS